MTTPTTIYTVPFISDDTTHRKEIARWMARAAAAIDGYATLSVSATLVATTRTTSLLGSGTVTCVIGDFAIAGREITLLATKDSTWFKNGAGGTATFALASGTDFTATVNSSITLVNNGTVWIEKSRKI